MSSYDQIQGFEYWNTEAWTEFIKDHVLPLHDSTSKLLKLRDFILTIVGTSGKVTLSEVERRRNDILPFFLGGIKEDGEYKENSLAKLVRLVLGIYINSEEWVTLEKEEGLRAFNYVTVKTETTPFLEFLKKLNEIALRIIKLVGIEPKEILESEIEELIHKPEELLEIIKMIYIKCLHVSANHNYYTFFALSTKTLLFKHLIIAYPRLQTSFNSLREFLGLEKIFEPRVDEAEVKRGYTIWGHLKGGLCDSLYELNNIIWENFSNESIKSVFNYVSTSLRDLKSEYAQKIQQKLEEIKWKFPTYIEMSYSYYYSHTYTITGPILSQHRYDEYSTSDYPWRLPRFEIEECNISLLKLLDELTPALFLGIRSFELKISNERLEILEIERR
ncbi:MAG: hypothetical protein QXE05_11160 [Nitrososphaeria archaeon]